MYPTLCRDRVQVIFFAVHKVVTGHIGAYVFTQLLIMFIGCKSHTNKEQFKNSETGWPCFLYPFYSVLIYTFAEISFRP